MDATKGGERLRSIAGLWQWLPAFRAVAESEHLPTAARILGVTPSTLSRSIAALEAAVGKPLFQRTGRSLRLDANGRSLLESVRDAMRWVEDGVAGVRGGGYRGDFVVASGGAGTTALVAPKLADMRHEYPELTPQIVTRAAGETGPELLRGRLDIAFQEIAAVPWPGLVVEEIGVIARGIYCGRHHPLYRRATVTLEDVANAEFVGPPEDPTGIPVDGWPPHLPRTVALVVDQVRVGIDICAALPLLAVLPQVLVADRGDALRLLPIDIVPPSTVSAIHRRPLGNKPTPALDLLDRLRRDSAKSGS